MYHVIPSLSTFFWCFLLSYSSPGVKGACSAKASSSSGFNCFRSPGNDSHRLIAETIGCKCMETSQHKKNTRNIIGIEYSRFILKFCVHIYLYINTSYIYIYTRLHTYIYIYSFDQVVIKKTLKQMVYISPRGSWNCSFPSLNSCWHRDFSVASG